MDKGRVEDDERKRTEESVKETEIPHFGILFSYVGPFSLPLLSTLHLHSFSSPLTSCTGFHGTPSTLVLVPRGPLNFDGEYEKPDNPRVQRPLPVGQPEVLLSVEPHTSRPVVLSSGWDDVFYLLLSTGVVFSLPSLSFSVRLLPPTVLFLIVVTVKEVTRVGSLLEGRTRESVEEQQLRA